MALYEDVLKKGKDFLNEGIDTYKEAETFKAVKENAIYIVIAVVVIIGLTYYVTKKMK